MNAAEKQVRDAAQRMHDELRRLLDDLDAREMARALRQIEDQWTPTTTSTR